MELTQNFKKLVLGTAVMASVAFLLPSCENKGTSHNDNGTMGDNRNEKDPKEVAENQNDEMLETRKAEKDAQFLVEAAEINLEEIQLGQLAQTKSTDAEVKKIGQMMVTDHTKALNEVKALAAKKGIQIPTTLTEDGQEAYKRLSDKKERYFNEDYCDVMVRGHKKAINKFEEAAKDATDSEIRTWASSMLPGLRTHLEHADICQSKDKDDKKVAAAK